MATVTIAVSLLLAATGCTAGERVVAANGSGGAMTILVAADGGQNYDPQTNAAPSSGEFMMPVFDSLLKEDVTGAFSPGLATKWEFSQDEKTLTLTLRSGVVFHDGTPFDAQAVKANIERGQTNKKSVVVPQLGVIGSMEVPNPTTLVLHLKAPAGSLLGFLAGPAGMMGSPKAWGNTDYGTHPVGTGPWQVSPRSTPGSNMVYTAFDRYWEASSVRVPVVNVRVGSESTFVASLSGNSAQAVMLTGAPTDAKTLRANGLPVKDSGTTYLHLLYLNKSGALADPRVRQAISLAIDRKAICEALLAGACTPTAQPLQPKSWAYDKSTPAPTRNVDKAKALLAEAGQSRLTFKTVVSSAGTQLQTELSAIQQMLGDVGITMTVSPMPVVQLLPSLANGTAQAYYSVNTGGADPAIPIITMTAPAYNPGGYSEPGLKTAFEQANRAVSQQDRAVAYQKVSRQYQETAYNVVVLNQDLRFATAKAVQGVIGRDPLVIDARGVVVP